MNILQHKSVYYIDSKVLRIFGHKREERTGGWRNYIRRGFIICTLHQGDKKKEDKMGESYSTYRRDEK
jgi:hypothetical protein